MTQYKQPVWKAVLLAPIAAPLVVTAVMAWDEVSVSGLAGLSDVPVAALFVFMFGLPISYAVMLIFGLPYVLWLRSRNRLAWFSVCIGSAVLGSVTWSSYWQLSLRPPSIVKTIAVGAAIGLIVGVVFSWAAGLIIRSSRTPIALSK